MFKILCKLFGHKKPWLCSRDNMRVICPRCSYTTFSYTAIKKVIVDYDWNELRSDIKGVLFSPCQTTQYLRKFL